MTQLSLPLHYNVFFLSKFVSFFHILPGRPNFCLLLFISTPLLSLKFPGRGEKKKKKKVCLDFILNDFFTYLFKLLFITTAVNLNTAIKENKPQTRDRHLDRLGRSYCYQPLQQPPILVFLLVFSYLRQKKNVIIITTIIIFFI